MNISKTWNPYADIILINGKIYTVAITIDEIKKGKTQFPILDKGVVAIKDGKIIEVTNTNDINKYKGENTRVIDLNGKVVIPGMIDSHMHAFFAGINMMNVELRGTNSLDEVLKLLKEKVDVTKDGEWVNGQCWNNTVWKDDRFPTREDLDKVSPNNPVFLMRLCYHVAVVNTKALELAGITKDTPDPEGGVIGRYENGEPNGLLYENAAMGLVQKVIPPLTSEELVEAINVIGQELISQGIVGVIDANLSVEQMRAYFKAYKDEKLKYRARLMYYLDTAVGSVKDHLRRLDEASTTTGFGNDMLKLNAVKITLDGIPASKTAFMRKPYKLDPSTRGFTTVVEDELKEMVVKSHKLGWQVGIHTVGNAAADVALEGFKEGHKISPIQDKRHYLIHHPWPVKEQLETMKELNVGVALQPTMLHLLGEAPVLHEEMAHQNIPCKTYFDNGIVAGGSSDCPVVPFNPFLGMWSAVTRLDSEGNLWGAEERITPVQALIMWTKNSAFFSHEEDIRGSIEVGNLADLVVVDRDFVQGPVEEIKDTKVIMTMVDGKILYEH
ncbi:amidohydrolase [Hathewaya limosa]|uniref:Amidohydrolase YtcJ n=1 Tax=Hathewaya limosa TaxID=1536 RepID=A0ABU0JSZ0_HATLI|nr:amidohydrolase [Hathewaya limosa]MDQ0480216.1 putative amidohydrolase YtcJ [Hathewaya limosa]